MSCLSSRIWSSVSRMVKLDLSPASSAMAAQDLDADRMEGAEPGHALDGFADEHADARLHLARGLVGEGDGEDLGGPGAAGGEDMGDAGGEHARLAGAGTRQHEDGALGGLDGQTLLGVQGLRDNPVGGGPAGAAMARAAMPEIGGGLPSPGKGWSSGKSDIRPNVVIRGPKARRGNEK